MECPDYRQGPGRFDYVEHTDTCYIVHIAAFGNAVDWNKARESCRSLAPGVDIASIHCSWTNTFLGNITTGDTWIGGFKDLTSNTWEWADGSPWNYDNWKNGQWPRQDSTGHVWMRNGIWKDYSGSGGCEWAICQYNLAALSQGSTEISLLYQNQSGHLVNARSSL